jgi:hypothetical protein
MALDGRQGQMNVLSSIGEWWRWRLGRARVHVHGVAEYRHEGTIVARDGSRWQIEDNEGRVFLAPIADSNVINVSVGDRVEFEPMGQSTAATSLLNLWTIVRKVEQQP